MKYYLTHWNLSRLHAIVGTRHPHQGGLFKVNWNRVASGRLPMYEVEVYVGKWVQNSFEVIDYDPFKESYYARRITLYRQSPWWTGIYLFWLRLCSFHNLYLDKRWMHTGSTPSGYQHSLHFLTERSIHVKRSA